jgi:hypothetical protein
VGSADMDQVHFPRRAQDFGNPDEGPTRGTVFVQDTYEFIGINHLVFFLVYFVYAIVFIGSSWSQNKVGCVTNIETLGAANSEARVET